MRNKDSLILSLDLGTSSVRAALVNIDLEILYKSQEPLSIQTELSRQALQDAEKVIRASIDCLRNVFQWAEQHGYKTGVISFSSSIASLVCLDNGFKPIEPALTYLDLRAHEQAEQLITEYGHEYFAATATPMHASYWLPKFLWMQSQDSKYSSARYYATLKDLLIHRLTGQFVIDYCNAVATGMCDVSKGEWDQRLLAIAGIASNQLPEIVPSTHILKLSDSRKSLFGEQGGDTHIVVGALDGVLSSLGVGAIYPGQVTTMIGSSGAVRIAADKPLTSPSPLKSWSYPLEENLWIRGGAINSGGVVTQWLAKNFSSKEKTDQDSYEELFVLAEGVSPGAEGLRFLPYLFGERAPLYNERACGVYFGIGDSHGREHFARAGLEGILYALYSVFEMVTDQRDRAELEVRGSGGYLRSQLMLQMQADLFGMPVHVPDIYESSLIGTAILAYKALSQIKTYQELSDTIRISTVYYPDMKKYLIYQEGYQRFLDLCQHLQPLFK